MGVAIKKDRQYTYRDYLTWPEGERWEIIECIAYNMSPAPIVKHQAIALNFSVKLKTHQNNPCYTGIAPTDIVLDEFNVVQPDVFVVCDESKITDENIKGAPDLIVEVISPSTEVKDRREKKNLYEKFGVREYILAFPEREYIERYLLRGGKYDGPELFNWDEVLHLDVFDIRVDLCDIFDKERGIDHSVPEEPSSS